MHLLRTIAATLATTAVTAFAQAPDVQGKNLWNQIVRGNAR